MKKEIKPDQVVKDLIELFEMKDNKFGSKNFGNEFLINKQHFERFQVTDKLQEYFNDKVIIGGYLEVSSMTLIFTRFKMVVIK